MRLSALAFAVWSTACGPGAAPSELGLNAMVRVEGAQFVEGPMPEGEHGPRVTSIDNTRTRIVIGETMKPLRGTLEPSANAVALARTGDPGHWIITAEPPNADTPDLLSFDLRLIFSPQLSPGPIELILRAVDHSQNYGPPTRVALDASATTEIEGELVVSLSWDKNADLDLHLLNPGGTDIWARNPVEDGAVLQLDSNAACVIDGRRVEAINYAAAPPNGAYLVRVDAFSLCGELAARWDVEVILRGETIARARGISVESATRGEHNAGAGVTALTFEVR